MAPFPLKVWTNLLIYGKNLGFWSSILNLFVFFESKWFAYIKFQTFWKSYKRNLGVFFSQESMWKTTFFFFFGVKLL